MKREPLKALINISQLLKEPIGSSQSYDISEMIDEEVEGFVEGAGFLCVEVKKS